MTIRFDSRRSSTSASNLNSVSSSVRSDPINMHMVKKMKVQLYNESVYYVRVLRIQILYHKSGVCASEISRKNFKK